MIVPKHYDCAIAYHGMNAGCLTTVLYCINADKKVAWIHGDHPFVGKNQIDAEKVYQQFDRIFCVSPSMCERFLADFPSVANITDSYKNILSVTDIQGLAHNQISEQFNSNYLNIVTVGRISPEKGQDLIPETISRLKKLGLSLKWYLIGDGQDIERIRELCDKFAVQDDVFFLGLKQNPYPYIMHCDIYVQPSYTEGYCLTVCEAGILEKPIVLTEATAAAAGIWEDQMTAIVVKHSSEDLANGILRIYSDKDLQKIITNNLKRIDFSNQDEIQKIIKFI